MAKEVLSVVLPSYNEEKNIPLVYAEILKSIDKKRFEFELIFVNDGSADKTWVAIEKLSEKDSHVKGINLVVTSATLLR